LGLKVFFIALAFTVGLFNFALASGPVRSARTFGTHFFAGVFNGLAGLFLLYPITGG
jgi:hypothetical protein